MYWYSIIYTIISRLFILALLRLHFQNELVIGAKINYLYKYNNSNLNCLRRTKI